MLRILVVALVLLVAAMFMMPRPLALPENATLLPAPRPLPDVKLVDDAGRPFNWSSLEGRHALVFFGFTNCPDVCPLTLQLLARTRAALVERNAARAPAVVFVSVDPDRDSPERIAAYLDGFDEEFVGVTAPEAELEPLLAALGVGVEKHAHDGEQYTVTHNGAVYFLDAEGRWIAVSTPPLVPLTLAADFEKIRRRFPPPRS